VMFHNLTRRVLVEDMNRKNTIGAVLLPVAAIAAVV